MTYPTLNQLKEHMNVSSTSEDTDLAWCLDSAQGFVERYTGRVFVAVSETRYFTVALPWVDRERLRLVLFMDLHSVTSVTNGDGEALSDYFLMPHAAPYDAIRLPRSTGKRWTDNGEDAQIAIAGDWGYSDSCPDGVFYAVMEAARVYFNASKQGVGGPVQTASRTSGLAVLPAGLPPHVMEILWQYRRLSL
jgi:hypothetical protein